MRFLLRMTAWDWCSILLCKLQLNNDKCSVKKDAWITLWIHNLKARVWTLESNRSHVQWNVQWKHVVLHIHVSLKYIQQIFILSNNSNKYSCINFEVTRRRYILYDYSSILTKSSDTVLSCVINKLIRIK